MATDRNGHKIVSKRIQTLTPDIVKRHFNDVSTIKNDNLIDYMDLVEGTDGTLYLMMEHASGDL